MPEISHPPKPDVFQGIRSVDVPRARAVYEVLRALSFSRVPIVYENDDATTLTMEYFVGESRIVLVFDEGDDKPMYYYVHPNGGHYGPIDVEVLDGLFQEAGVFRG